MEKSNVGYRDIFREGEYRKLMLSSMINRFGDSVDAIAFTWLVYQITRSAAWSAIVFALNTLPNVVVQPFAGAIVEKMNKKVVIVSTHLLRAVVITVFALMYRFGMVNALVMAIVTLIITTVESFNLPASSAFNAQVIKKEHLTSGMSLSTMLSSAATLVGMGLGGVIIAAWGVVPAMMIDVATFVAAALLIWSMHGKRNIEALENTAESAVSKADSAKESSVFESFMTTFKDGMNYVRRTPVVRNFCFLCVAINFMLVPINALQAPIAEEIYKKGSEILSCAGAFGAIGGIVGSALLPFVTRKLSPLKVICLGTGVLGIGIVGIATGGIFSGSAIACYISISAWFFIMLIASSLMGGVLGIQFMKTVDSDYMARASAVFNASSTASMPVGSLIISALLSRIATGRILLISAVFAGIVLLVMILTKPELEKKEELSDAA